MKVLTTLWGEIKGVFGKAYLLAGALPATLLVLGWLWYVGVDRVPEGGGAEVRARSLVAVVATALEGLTGDEATDEVVTVILLTLALGLVFYAGRTSLVDLLQRLPGRALDPLRRTLTRRQHARWLRADREVHERLHQLTILERWLTDLDLVPPVRLPSTERVAAAGEMRSASAEARRVFAALLDAGPSASEPPSREATSAILAGLRALYAYACDPVEPWLLHRRGEASLRTYVRAYLGAGRRYGASAGPRRRYATAACVAELAAWRLLVARRGAGRLLQVLADAVNVEWAEARSRLDAFPEARWLRPTSLGTGRSALDDYAEDRYGIPTSTLVHRLGGAMPEAERKEIGDARLQVETLVNLSAAMAALAAAVGLSAGLAALRNLRPVGPDLLVRATGFALDEPLAWSLRIAAFVVAPALLAWLFYRAAVVSQGELAEKVVRAVDLHRLALATALGFERPETVGEEQELWAELASFFADAKPLDPSRPIVPADEE